MTDPPSPHHAGAPQYPFLVQLLPHLGAWVALGFAYSIFLSSSPELRAEATCALPWPVAAVGISIHVGLVAVRGHGRPRCGPCLP